MVFFITCVKSTRLGDVGSRVILFLIGAIHVAFPFVLFVLVVQIHGLGAKAVPHFLAVNGGVQLMDAGLIGYMGKILYFWEWGASNFGHDSVGDGKLEGGLLVT